ncbi:hypothetical protein LPJ81_003014, partial [Coemansia sp. IMI 209127]
NGQNSSDGLADADLSGYESDNIDTSRIVSYSRLIQHDLQSFFGSRKASRSDSSGATTESSISDNEDRAIDPESLRTNGRQEGVGLESENTSFPASTALTLMTPYLRSIIGRKVSMDGTSNQLSIPSGAHNLGKYLHQSPKTWRLCCIRSHTVALNRFAPFIVESNSQNNQTINAEIDQPTADMLQAYSRAYPLRKRLEKNLHPYTKLVWTDPRDLLSSRNLHRDLSLLQESQSGAKRASQGYMDVNIDDLEDEDYIPGSPGVLADDGTQPTTESMEIDIGSLSFRSPRNQNGVTYRHLASRQRHRQRGTQTKRPRYEQRVAGLLSNQLGQDGYASDLADIDPDQLPSISSLLGLGPGDGDSHANNDETRRDDPFDVPFSGDLRINNRLDRRDRRGKAHNNQVQLYSDLSSSSPGEQSGIPAEGYSLPHLSADNSDPGRDRMDDAMDAQRSTSLSRQNFMDTDSRRNSSSPNESGRILKGRKRKPNNLLRQQIRGVLPFSFMRDVSMDNLSNGDGDGEGRASSWRKYSERNNNRRRVMTSESSDDNSAISDNSSPLPTGHVLGEPSNVSYHDRSGADNIAELFSDPINSPSANNVSTRDDSLPAFGHNHLRFNFMDVYEWQYPPLVPTESIGHAPDFLRVAARECRRRGIFAKATHDDPFRKSITIEPRTEIESRQDDDIARSILMSWKLGVIDVRRVYFCDDEYELSDEPIAGNGDMEVALNAFSDGMSAPEQQLGSLPSPILVSDGEAIEDNRTYDRIAASRRPRQKHSTSRQHDKPKKPRHKRQQKLVSGSKASRSFFDIKKPSRNPRGGLVEQRTPLAQRLGSVMNEFAAFDSDSDTNAADSPRRGRLSRPSSRPVKDRMSGAQSGRDQQESFINRFNRQQKPQQRSLSTRRRHRSAHSHPSRSDNPCGTENAIFIFDDDVSRPTTSRDVYDRVAVKQTKLLSNRLVAPSSSSTGIGASAMDSLAEKIGQRRLNPKNSGRQVRDSAQSRVRKWSSVAASRSRCTLQRKAVPTRVQIVQHHAVPRAIEGGFGRNGSLDTTSHNHLEPDGPVPRIPFVSRDSARALRCFHSGTQFGYSMWISKGGLRRILKRVCGALNLDRRQPAASASDANTTSKRSDDDDHPDHGASVFYNYGDILRIEASATPQEFVQAYTTLLILWHEKLIMPRHSGAQAREIDSSVEADVFRWIEFAQQFILATLRSKSALVQLVRGTVECVHDGILRLEQLAAIEEYNVTGAACIGLSFAVTVLQLALAVAGVRNNTGSAGPRAVGEYDEIPAGWGPERFGPEVDKCLQTIVKLLSLGPQRHDPFRLGHAEQVWVALLHVFSIGSQSSSSRGKDKRPYSQGESRGISTDYYGNNDNVESSLAAAGTIVQFSGIWSTVRHVCKSECSTDSQRADSLWSAFVYLLPLAQFSDEGIAAPRAALPLRPHLASMAEAAVEKQLLDCLKRSDNNKQPRASDEALVRQAFVRTHSTVVEHGIGFGPDSHVYITLYRYLESNSFSSLSIEPLPSLPRLFTRYCGSIKRESSPSDTCTILWLKALDMTLGEWNAQLAVLQPSSKPYRHLLRNIRSAVSKMLPTRILTFDTSESRAQLSTLANYYAVFLFFLHAMPSGVVRSVRLYTQLQSLLKFKESTSPVARRVYFEAWSAAAMVIARNLRHTLEKSGHVGGLVEKLVGKCTTIADAKDHYDALELAVNSWGESVSTVIGDCLARDQQGGKGHTSTSWTLADVAFMYLQRVLTSEVLASHAPTMLVLIHSVLRQPFLINVAAANNASHVIGNAHEGKAFASLNTALLERLLEIIRIWQDAVSGKSCSDSNGTSAANQADDHREKDVGKETAPVEREENSQTAFAAFDSTELLEVTAEVEEIERQASFAAVNIEILRLVHEKYIPALRLRIILNFTSLSANPRSVQLALVPSQQQARTLVAIVSMLAHMVSSCVDAGMRAWESFFEEHGRESLYLVPDRRGRRL